MAQTKFEDALARLEIIVGQLEKGDLPLEESLKIFEEGVRLSKNCLKMIEEAERKVDKEKVARLASKISKGKRFDMDDFREQLEQMLNMGGLTGLMDKLPGMGQLPQNAKAMVNDREIHRMVAIINSMTRQERSFPDVIKGSRRRRIAAGSGTQVQDVNRLLKQYLQMRKMMQKMSKSGMGKMLRSLKGKTTHGFPFQGL